ncbi:MAG: hypothetical protein Q6362_012155 [Candidatus Wukongarchaeota archaeon]|nr:hypothetical protein [Candidatus Wukongarchaeota archaeon]
MDSVITLRLKMCNAALERAAWIMDALTLDDLEDNIIESTCPSKTCLIEVRSNNKLIEKIKANRQT